VKKAERDDLVIVCVTGGCTSLTLSPPEGITLKDVMEVSKLLLESGAPLEDMNIVRKHLSLIGGGKLALLASQANIVSLIAVDEVAGVPWGPTVPDTTTFTDARTILMRYDLWDTVPESIRDYLVRADVKQETAKSSDFTNSGVRVTNVVFAENGMICNAAERRATELGLNTSILTTRLEGEAKDVGVVLSCIANEIEVNQRPIRTPCALIAGGETTVTIKGDHGEGGRNQELALAAAVKLSGNKRAALVSIGTDGTDGPTDIAGAIIDGYTAETAKHKNMDLFQYLKKHDSSTVFRRIGGAIYTSNTGTNLMDLVVLCVT
jgi:glycerate-2-kinase